VQLIASAMRSVQAAWRAVVARFVTSRRTGVPLDAQPDPILPDTIALVVPQPVPEPEPEQPVQPSAAEEPSTDLLHWRFRTHILDRLDEYFDCMKRMRQYDHDAYKLYSRVGLSIPNEHFLEASLSARPSFGGFFFALADRQSELVQPSFVYFSKVVSPTGVQRARGDIYRITTLYDGKRKVGRNFNVAAPLSCHVAVDERNGMTLLKELCMSERTVTRRDRSGRKRDSIRLKTHSWQYPAWVSEISSEKGTSPEEFACAWLRTGIATHMASTKRLVVQVARGSCRAAFSVDLARAPYFFADRDPIELARDGKRKRIFHAVQAHNRALTGGKTTTVKHHYRGLRSFQWKSYQVHIVFPKNNFVYRMDVPGVYVDDIPEDQRAKYFDSERTAEVLDRVLAS
jgi:hypothetical protein